MYPIKQTNSWTFLPNTWHNGKSLLAPTSQLDSEFQLHLTPKGVKIRPKLHFSDVSNTTKTSTILSTDHTETFLTFCRCRQFQDLTDKQVQMLDIQLCSNKATNLGSTNKTSSDASTSIQPSVILLKPPSWITTVRSLKLHFPDLIPIRFYQWHLLQIKKHGRQNPFCSWWLQE